MLEFFTYYEFLPAIIYNASLFIIIRLLIIPLSYRRGKNFVALSISGAIGFFVFIPIALYPAYHSIYVMVPLFFFLQAIFGLIGSLVLQINPFNSGDILFVKKAKQIQKESTSEKAEIANISGQSKEDSMQLIYNKLTKIDQPFYNFKEFELAYGDEQYSFEFLALSPRGVFQIFPCNWGGEMVFNNSHVVKEREFEDDTKDYSITHTYRRRLLKNLLHSIGMENTPIYSVICMTNPSASKTVLTSDYHVVTISELEEFLTLNRGETLKPNQLNDLKIIIESSIVDSETKI